MSDSGQTKRRSNVRLREFSKSLPMSLLTARESVMQRFRSSLRLFNITEQQWRVLRALSSVHEIEMTALAKATFLLPPSLSRIVKDLDERKLVLRRFDEEDARRSLLSLSPDGHRLIEAVAPYSEAIYSEITTAFGDDKLKLLQGLLRELQTTVEALGPVSYEGAQVEIGAEHRNGERARGRPRKVDARE